MGKPHRCPHPDVDFARHKQTHAIPKFLTKVTVTKVLVTRSCGYERHGNLYVQRNLEVDLEEDPQVDRENDGTASLDHRYASTPLPRPAARQAWSS